ncbi:Fip1 motif-domain-containing protein [Rhodocollybia butyracea]|uniref:Fip1 motif-domain-containing protein n=1 Tax=Rhodocollybia butyracea TaxID=206335 RepID=A0A9P5Q2C3_9AGAR|nr:Fip1 motif-domain-containing protein [Rhodocollybia butyracea]
METNPSLAGPSFHAQVPTAQVPPSAQTTPAPLSASQASTSSNNLNISLDNGVDPSTLPPVKAPPSHPEIDPTVPGVLDGRAIFEVDMGAMTDRPWRRAGSDISDWFNYGFDELSWEAYCYRRRDIGELADVLKLNVINFSAMPEEQLTALPSELRQMVMTGATAMMNGAPSQGMMNPGVMMDMGMMNGMGIGMNGDMVMGQGMGQQMMPVDQRGMMMQDGAAQGPIGPSGTPEQSGGPVGMMQDGFNSSPGMNMGMQPEFSMQDQPQIFPGQGMEGPVPQNIPPVPSSRGPTPSYRARGSIGTGMRGARGFPARGRGRGGMYGSEADAKDEIAPVVARPASPLPPNVPTGPRNQNKYKDRDGNAPAVDGLDYGGDRVGGNRTPTAEPEERSSSRKRRGSPILDEVRGPKRR